jgi:DNA-binding MarR family transcriptional regulator
MIVGHTQLMKEPYAMKTTGLKSHQESREGISKLHTVLNMFHAMQPGMEVQTILVFLQVAKFHPDPCPMGAIQDSLQLARAATSRNVANLTSVNWRGEPGLDLVATEINAYDSRCRDCRLTKKGQAQYGMIDEVLGSNKPIPF